MCLFKFIEPICVSYMHVNGDDMGTAAYLLRFLLANLL